MNNKRMNKIIITCIIVSSCFICMIITLLIILNSKNKIENNTTYNQERTVDPKNKKPAEKKKSELVEENQYNKFTIQAVTEESLLNKYIEDFKYNALNHLEDSYNSLDKEYREKRFGNIEKYEKYINSRQDIIKNMLLRKYQINKYDEYEQYICLDQYENYYIFNRSKQQ